MSFTMKINLKIIKSQYGILFFEVWNVIGNTSEASWMIFQADEFVCVFLVLTCDRKVTVRVEASLKTGMCLLAFLIFKLK